MALKDFVRKSGIKTEYATVQLLITEGTKEGWTLKADAATGSPIMFSKAGNPQLVFQDKNKDRVYVRISDNALDAITADANPLELPVYNSELHEGGTPEGKVIGSMLVIGVLADDTKMIDAKVADIAKLFKANTTRPVVTE